MALSSARIVAGAGSGRTARRAVATVALCHLSTSEVTECMLVKSASHLRLTWVRKSSDEVAGPEATTSLGQKRRSRCARNRHRQAATDRRVGDGSWMSIFENVCGWTASRGEALFTSLPSATAKMLKDDGRRTPSHHCAKCGCRRRAGNCSPYTNSLRPEHMSPMQPKAERKKRRSRCAKSRHRQRADKPKAVRNRRADITPQNGEN